MDLTTRSLRQFNGGQIKFETKDRGINFLRYGQIKRIKLQERRSNALLVVELAWLAEGEGFPSTIKRWVKISPVTYRVRLADHPASDFGSGRILLKPLIGHRLVVLYPKGDVVLSTSQVVGL